MKTFEQHQTVLGSKFRKGKNNIVTFHFSAQVDLEGNPSKISGGGLIGSYTAVQFHFHWGSSSDKGSEHTIDGKQYPLEVCAPTFSPFRPQSHCHLCLAAQLFTKLKLPSFRKNFLKIDKTVNNLCF